MNLLNIDKPVLVDDLLPPQENLEVLKHIATRPWVIQHEENSEDAKFKSGFLNDFQHTGYAITALDDTGNNQNLHPTDPLVIWSRIVTYGIIHKLQANNCKKVSRVHWNYYTQGQQGIGHVDRDPDNFISILYNPHTTDGATEILGVKYPDKMGQAKVFKSNWLHKGIATINDKSRCSLNIILEY